MNHWEQQYIEVTNKIRGILDRAQNEKRNLTEEESATVDRMFADAEQFRKQMEAEKRAAALARVIEERAIAPSVIERAENAAQPTQRTALIEYIRRGINNMPIEQRALLAGTGGGSYLVPHDLYQEIIKALTARVWLRQMARVIQISTNTDVPVATGRPTAAYVAENAATTPSDPTITQKQLRAKKMVSVVQVSEELLSDSSFNVEAEITSLIAEAFADLENAKFVSGNGTSEPAGFVSAVTAGANAASVNTVTADNIIDLYFSLPAQYQANAVFVMRSATLAYIAKQKDSQNRYLWMPPFGTNQFNTILGRPVITDEGMPAMGASARSIVFFDPRFYLIADRTTMEVQRLEELYIANGLKAFRATRRNDGVFTVADAGRALVHPAS